MTPQQLISAAAITLNNNQLSVSKSTPKELIPLIRAQKPEIMALLVSEAVERVRLSACPRQSQGRGERAPALLKRIYLLESERDKAYQAEGGYPAFGENKSDWPLAEIKDYLSRLENDRPRILAMMSSPRPAEGDAVGGQESVERKRSPKSTKPKYTDILADELRQLGATDAQVSEIISLYQKSAPKGLQAFGAFKIKHLKRGDAK